MAHNRPAPVVAVNVAVLAVPVPLAVVDLIVYDASGSERRRPWPRVSVSDWTSRQRRWHRGAPPVGHEVDVVSHWGVLKLVPVTTTTQPPAGPLVGVNAVTVGAANAGAWRPSTIRATATPTPATRRPMCRLPKLIASSSLSASTFPPYSAFSSTEMLSPFPSFLTQPSSLGTQDDALKRWGSGPTVHSGSSRVKLPRPPLPGASSHPFPTTPSPHIQGCTTPIENDFPARRLRSEASGDAPTRKTLPTCRPSSGSIGILTRSPGSQP